MTPTEILAWLRKSPSRQYHESVEHPYEVAAADLIESLQAENEKLRALFDEQKQLAIGMFWAGGKLDEMTVRKLRDAGFDLVTENERLRKIVDELIEWERSATPARFMQELKPIIARAKGGTP